MKQIAEQLALLALVLITVAFVGMKMLDTIADPASEPFGAILALTVVYLFILKKKTDMQGEEAAGTAAFFAIITVAAIYVCANILF